MSVFKDHPKGLFVLFFTEMWERFSYYGMRAILVLYLVAETKNGGLGWSNTQALELYGWYTMLVYFLGIPGGLIADRWIGQKKAVMIGGGLLVCGHSLMAYTEPWAFFTALILIILGVGLLKPNISTMVGGLYKERDDRRDAGFTIFYMGINLGSFISTLTVGYLAEKIGWHYGFGLAGVGMLLGQIMFIRGQKHLSGVGDLIERHDSDKNEKTSFTKIEKDRFILVFLAYFAIFTFFSAFEQAGGLMNLYTKDYTNRFIGNWEMPITWFQSMNPFFIIVFAGLVAYMWVQLSKKGKQPSGLFKMGLGTIILGIGFILMMGASNERLNSISGMSSLYWLVGAYFFHTIGELFLSPSSLSYITKMAPKRMVATTMGVYWGVMGLASKTAAQLGIWAEKMGEFGVFSIIAYFTIGFGLLYMLISKAVKKLGHNAE